ncbi:MAG: glycine--tRNA ligase subunit beta [Dissulfurimicrobium sp.]|uniref:glycine--tRNA ligase subunit beta n=1 Tax=Dissulfurimicrobium sp. TaxID=2022436 RepID=UPI00404AD037
MKTENLLFEIGTEEIPAAFIPTALKEMERLAEDGLKEFGFFPKEISCFGTPRRLALFIKDLPDCQPDREEEIIGPPERIAFNSDGTLTRAGEGFLKAQGVSKDVLIIKDTGKGRCLAVHRLIKGLETKDILASFLPSFVSRIPFPKTMKWGASSFRFARPIRWIVALFGEAVIPFEIAGVKSDRLSYGHRFMAPMAFEVRADKKNYIAAMRAHFVIADMKERKEMLLKDAERAALDSGGILLKDDDLVDLNVNLVEYPSAVCGSFDERFLELPREVLITSMKEHQKYFAVTDSGGRLRPNFVAINNTRSPDENVVKKGHERVLRARLTDAAFFFEEDMKVPLHERVPALSGIVFNQHLGTMLDKTMRVRDIALYIAKILAPDRLDLVDRAAYLAKADLLTGMVGEFPGLQGVMGRQYALRSGEAQEVAIAIEEHYMPVRAGGPLPKTVIGAILSMADKVDTICGMFAIGLQPSGAQDPYALRRLALGVLSIIEDKGFSVSLKAFLAEALKRLGRDIKGVAFDFDHVLNGVMAFLKGRFVNNLISRGMSCDIIEAAVRAGFDDVGDCLKRVYALSNVRMMPEFESLGIAFKRVMNILKGFGGGEIKPEFLIEDEEKALFHAYSRIEQEVAGLLDSRKYERALYMLLSLKPYIDSFFDHVMVMVDDDVIRTNRLSLLWLIARSFLRVGDLSAIAVK